MRIIFSEANHNYENYFFPYQVLLTTDPEDDLTKVYQLGFLPFRNRKNLFYLSRSCRSNIKYFSLSSENKRVLKKTDQFRPEVISLSEFNYTPEVQRSCKLWARQAGWKISTSSLKVLFKNHFFNKLYLWKDEASGKIICYQILYESKTILHTASVFYDPSYHSTGLGTRLLLEASQNAHQKELDFAYMGTCYGMYKRSISGFEFFNGFEWTNSIDELKFLTQRDKKHSYTLKEKEYLGQFCQDDLEIILNKKGLRLKP